MSNANNSLSKTLVFSNTEYPVSIVGANNFFDLTEVGLTLNDYYEFRFKLYIYSPHTYIYDLACMIIKIEDINTGLPINTLCCARLRLMKGGSNTPPYTLRPSVYCPFIENGVYAEFNINFEFSGWQTLVFGFKGKQVGPWDGYFMYYDDNSIAQK